MGKTTTNKPLKVIIAGSRDIFDFQILEQAIQLSGFNIKEVVSGGARGVDKSGECWAKRKNIPIKQFIPDWGNIDKEDVVVRQNQYGSYNAKAGMERNEEMAKYADALILIWDGESSGSKNMLETAERYNLKIYVYEI